MRYKIERKKTWKQKGYFQMSIFKLVVEEHLRARTGYLVDIPADEYDEKMVMERIEKMGQFPTKVKRTKTIPLDTIKNSLRIIDYIEQDLGDAKLEYKASKEMLKQAKDEAKSRKESEKESSSKKTKK